MVLVVVPVFAADGGDYDGLVLFSVRVHVFFVPVEVLILLLALCVFFLWNKS